MSGRFKLSFRVSLKWFFLACLGIGVGFGLVGRHYVQQRLEKERHERRLAALPILEEGWVVQFRGDQVVEIVRKHKVIDPRWSAALADVPEIEALHVFQSGFADQDARHLAGLRNMKEILAYRTPLTDAALIHLRRMHELETLDLRETAITGVGFRHLAHLPKLKKVDLRGTSVNDAGLAAISRVASLEEVDLRGTQICGSGVRHLKGLTKIRMLQLFMPMLDEVAGLEELDQIESLDLVGPGLNKRHIDQIVGMESLRGLHISMPRFDRPLIGELARLGKLDGISLNAFQPVDDPQPRIRWEDVVWLSEQLPDTDVKFHLDFYSEKATFHPQLFHLCRQWFIFRGGVRVDGVWAKAQQKHSTGRDRVGPGDGEQASTAQPTRITGHIRIQGLPQAPTERRCTPIGILNAGVSPR